MKLTMWHWRDVLCWFKLKFSKNGYSVKEFCGKCKKCNRLFGAWGVIPCPMRFPIDGSDYTKEKSDGIPSLSSSLKDDAHEDWARD